MQLLKLLKVFLLPIIITFLFSCSTKKHLIDAVYENKFNLKNLEKGYKTFSFFNIGVDHFYSNSFISIGEANIKFLRINNNIYALVDNKCFIPIIKDGETSCDKNFIVNNKKIKKLKTIRIKKLFPDESERAFYKAYYYIPEEYYLIKFEFTNRWGFLGAYLKGTFPTEILLVEYIYLKPLIDKYNEQLRLVNINFFKNLTALEKNFLREVNVYEVLDIKSVEFDNLEKFLNVVKILKEIHPQDTQKEIISNLVEISLDNINDLETLEYVYNLLGEKQKAKISDKLKELYIQTALKKTSLEEVNSVIKHCEKVLNSNCEYAPIQEKIAKLYEEKALSSNDLKLVKQIFEKYPENANIKSHLVELLIKENTFDSFFTLYKLIPSPSLRLFLLKQLLKLAKAKDEKIKLEKLIFDNLKDTSHLIKAKLKLFDNPTFYDIKGSGFFIEHGFRKHIKIPLLIEVSLNKNFPFKPAYGIYKVTLTLKIRTYGKYKKRTPSLSFWSSSYQTIEKNTYNEDTKIITLTLKPPYNPLYIKKNIDTVITFFERGNSQIYAYFYPLKNTEVFVENIKVKYDGNIESSNLDFYVNTSKLKAGNSQKLETKEVYESYSNLLRIDSSVKIGQTAIVDFIKSDKLYMSSRSYSRSEANSNNKCFVYYKKCKSMCGNKNYCYRCDEFKTRCEENDIIHAAVLYCDIKCRGLSEKSSTIFSSSDFDKCANECEANIKWELRR